MGVYRELSQIDSIVIHCADTPNGRADTIEDVDRWHGQRVPPFRRNMALAPKHQPQLTHVGYHFVIEVDGAIRLGRPLHESGAHVARHNRLSIGICLIGYDRFSHAQWDALRALVLMLQHPGNGLNIQQICGHRDLYSGKTCPGFDVAEWINNDFQPLLIHILEASC